MCITIGACSKHAPISKCNVCILHVYVCTPVHFMGSSEFEVGGQVYFCFLFGKLSLLYVHIKWIYVGYLEISRSRVTRFMIKNLEFEH